MWLQRLILAALAAIATGWECGVDSGWESLLATEIASNQGTTTRAFQRSSTLQPIRIHAYYGEISAFPSAQAASLKQAIVNSAAFYARFLSVYPLTENWVLAQAICGYYSVPNDHQITGIPNVDLVIYVTSFSNSGANYITARAGAWLLMEEVARELR